MFTLTSCDFIYNLIKTNDQSIRNNMKLKQMCQDVSIGYDHKLKILQTCCNIKTARPPVKVIKVILKLKLNIYEFKMTDLVY